MTEFEEKAYQHWIRVHERDTVMDTVQLDPFRAFSLKEARVRLHLTEAEVARRLNISRQAYNRLEFSEKKGKISIDRFKAAAEAMGCEFKYEIKSEKEFQMRTWETVLNKARLLPFYRNVSSPVSLAGHIDTLIHDTRAPVQDGGTFRFISRSWAKWQKI